MPRLQLRPVLVKGVVAHNAADMSWIVIRDHHVRKANLEGLGNSAAVLLVEPPVDLNDEHCFKKYKLSELVTESKTVFYYPDYLLQVQSRQQLINLLDLAVYIRNVSFFVLVLCLATFLDGLRMAHAKVGGRATEGSQSLPLPSWRPRTP